MNISRYIALVAAVLFCYSFGEAQRRPTHSLLNEKRFAFSEMNRYDNQRRAQRLNSLASDWFHVIHYSLNISLQTAPNYLRGVITIRGMCNQDHPQFLTLDLMNTMHVDSLSIDGVAASVVQQP